MPAEEPGPVPPGEARWQCSIEAGGDEPRRLVVVRSARHPDGARVELDLDAARAQIAGDAWCTAVFAGGAVVALHVAHRTAPKAPPLWFAEVRESARRPPAVNLIAFTGHGQPAGALVDSSALTNVGVGSIDQLGALRWYPATGEVDQVYVQPDWRRRSVASALIAAAGTLSIARGWPRLWTDGQRTRMGEALRNASTWQHRAAPLTHVAPPMTPPAAGSL